MVMSDKVGGGDALLARLNELFTQDPEIDEIGLLFGIEADDVTLENAFAYETHKLGVAFSAGPTLFRAARTRFHALNAELSKHPDSCKSEELLACTRAILLICADFYTAWNTRKRYVTRGWLDALSEIAFTNLVFSLHPKSIDTWAYRRWLAARVWEERKDTIATFVDSEIAVCAVHTERTPRNYHAWSFRHWLVSKMDLAQLERELFAMERWCETHLMDHSGWNHRQHTINCLRKLLSPTPPHRGDGGDAFSEWLRKEFLFLSKIQASYPKYEALWCHRRFVVQSLLVQANGTSFLEEQEEGKVASNVDDQAATFLHIVTAGTVPSTDGASARLWKEIHESMDSQRVVTTQRLCRCLLQDAKVAWTCGGNNRFARRYALWVLERLCFTVQEKEQQRTLRLVNQAMRKSLATSDELLDDLWRGSSHASLIQ